jgi:hypothetical protein
MNLTAQSLYPERSATGIEWMQNVWAVMKTKISVSDGYFFRSFIATPRDVTHQTYP